MAPTTDGVVSVIVFPVQTGLLLPAVGVAGIGFTVTAVVPATLVHPAKVAVTEYVPLAAVVAPVMVGFCVVDVNEFGPVQLYVAPTIFVAFRFRFDPAHIGLLLDAVGAAGVGFTVTLTVPAALGHPPTVTTTLYVPDIASVADGRVGFCDVEENELGPVQVYVAPTTAAVERLIVEPVHTGLLLVGAGVAGVAFTTTLTVPAVLGQPPTVTVTE